MSTAKIYLAGPIKGQSYNDAVDWRLEFSRAVLRGGEVLCLDPMRAKTELKDASSIEDSHPESLMCGVDMIRMRDMSDLRRCDLLFVNLNQGDDVPLSLGSIWEMGFVAALCKPIVVWTGNDTIKNHPLLSVGAVFPTGDMKQCAQLCLSVLGMEVGW